MAKHNDKDFLYEANPACGMVYLTIDNNSPVHIGFHHRIKVEIKICQGKDIVTDEKIQNDGMTSNDRVCDVKNMTLLEANVNQNLQTNSDDDVAKEKSSLSEGLPVLIDKDPISVFPKLKDVLPIQKSQPKGKRSVKRVFDPGNSGFESSVKHKRISRPQNQKEPSRKNDLYKRMGRKNTGGVGKEIKQSLHQGEINDSSIVSSEPSVECDASNIKVEENEFYDDYDAEIDAKVSKSQSGPSKSYECEFCFKTFESKQDFFNHRKSKTESYNCSKCDKVFSFRAHLLVHMREHNNSMEVFSKLGKKGVCDVCSLDCKNLTALKKHMLTHTKEFFYKCCVCDKKICGFGAMHTHMIRHKNAGLIKCNCCDQYFSSRAELSKHQLALLEIKCNLCEEVFPNRTSRTMHYKLSHPDNILKCHLCTRMFSFDKDLENHMVYHTKYKKKQCTTCGKFVSRLEKHLLTHKSLKDVDQSELFFCDKCPMKFMLKYSLQRHQRTHSEERPFQCYQCHKSFACRSVLLKHIKTHSSVMPYECDVCGKRCKEKSNLKVHMRIHSDTKAFPCTLCTQAFSYKSSLDGHMRSKHSAEKDNFSSKRSLGGTNFSQEDQAHFINDKEHEPVIGNISNYPTVPVGTKEYTQASGFSKAFSTFLPSGKVEDLSRHNFPHSIDLLPVVDRSVDADRVGPSDSRFIAERSSFSLDS